MKKIISTSKLAALLTMGVLSTPAMADSEDILVDDVWARASIGINRPSAVYFTLRNTGGTAVRLVGVEARIAKRAAAHLSNTDQNGVLAMEPAGDVLLPPGREVAFQPGGLHIMLMDLQEPLEEGSSVRLELLFDDGGRMPVTVWVRGVAATGPRS